MPEDCRDFASASCTSVEVRRLPFLFDSLGSSFASRLAAAAWRPPVAVAAELNCRARVVAGDAG
ncbi:MAG: hypothetical protein CMJ58_11520 [Planctomycetaceae bacterium]|nr:hypothetical protein [Planctomycetaceae bacterium]